MKRKRHRRKCKATTPLAYNKYNGVVIVVAVVVFVVRCRTVQHRGVRRGAQHHSPYVAEIGRTPARCAAVGHGHPCAHAGLQAALFREGDGGGGLGICCS